MICLLSGNLFHIFQGDEGGALLALTESEPGFQTYLTSLACLVCKTFFLYFLFKIELNN